MVINTEAHAFPRFDMGKLFKTGWERKPRGKDGKLLPREENEGEAGKRTSHARVETKTVVVEQNTMA